MPRFSYFAFVATLSFAQAPVKTGLQFSDFYVHDPFILAHKESKTYYLYNAASPRQLGGQRGGVVAYKSKDLLHWDGPYTVFEVPDGLWADPREGVWAPEVHRYRGKYYLLATLHNSKEPLPYTDEEELPTYNGRKTKPHMRGTQIFVADRPDGPFKPLSNSPAPPADLMTLDGTLYVEEGIPFMVYAHEWLQVLDGMMEAVPLKADLSAAAGESFLLFKGSDAPWVKEHSSKPGELATYVTDGPFLYRTKNGKLVMLWSSYRDKLYVETLAYSTFREAAWTLEAGRRAGGKRQRSWNAVRIVRRKAHDGAAPALPSGPRQPVRNGRYRRYCAGEAPDRVLSLGPDTRLNPVHSVGSMA